MIDDVKGWRAGMIPVADNFARVGEGPPVEFFLRHHRLERLRFVPENIHADQREGFAFQLVHERPLVGPMGPSRESVFHPEI